MATKAVHRSMTAPSWAIGSLPARSITPGVGDTVEKINFPKLARVAQLVYVVAFEVANADLRPKRDRVWSEVPQPERRRRR